MKKKSKAASSNPQLVLPFTTFIMLVILIFLSLIVLLFPGLVGIGHSNPGNPQFQGLLTATLAILGATLGAGFAIYGAATAGAAAMAERPELSIWVLIFAALGEGLAIYGLIVAILILGKI